MVYLPAASTAGTYMALTVAAFEGIAAVDVVGVATGWAPTREDVDRLIDGLARVRNVFG